VTGEWVPIPDAEALTDVELEAASDAAGAMTFVRPEDGAFNPNNPNEGVRDALCVLTLTGTRP
jgi:secreted PhoX family phosphatase